MPSIFNRALDDDFIAKLRKEAKKEGWRKDVLADLKLLLDCAAST
jgi:hypothetical protein